MIGKSNRFFTVLIIPEKTSQVRRVVIPGWLVKGTIVGMIFTVVLAGIMVLDYWFVMNQISENKQLKIENRRLRQQVQIFRNKMNTIESTMDRIKTFATRLKVITNIEDRGGLLQSLNSGKLPDASTNVGAPSRNEFAQDGSPKPGVQPAAAESRAEAVLIPAASEPLQPTSGARDHSADDYPLRREYQEIDNRFSELNHESLLVEQILQDQYELLADQKAFLAALPTRKPAVGYFTSGFGVRKSPTGDRIKMHEGLDVANHPGTPIRATADGVVVFADVKSGYGQTLIIDHGYGLETWYAHNRRLLVGRGQKVKRGEAIAQLGNSGRSTGPHVHYEVRVNGTPVDPLSYILEN